MTRNVRFFDYFNGSFVKITLKPGQILRHYEAHDTEEGWDSNETIYQYDGDRVTCETINDGTDCDGRLTRHATYTMDGLTSREVEREQSALEYRYGVKSSDHYPVANWKEIANGQRDYTAESMGY